jgi:hypothetical protein
MRGVVIPGGGDVVVGQEFTDFDKGLDDGIEGEVFGFNLVTSEPRASSGSQSLPWFKTQGNALNLPQKHHVISGAKGPSRLTLRPLHWLRATPIAPSRGKKLFRWPEDTRHSRKVSGGDSRSSFIRWPDDHRRSRRTPQEKTRETRDAIMGLNPGLELVKKSYSQCAARRGSPVDGGHLLIAWASTPVRVFGGATIERARPMCGDF